MTTTRRHSGAWLLLIPGLLLLFCADLSAQERPRLSPAREQKLLERVAEIPEMIEQGSLNAGEIPNPHWRRDACQACHDNAPDAAARLRNPAINRLCGYCHDPLFDHSYIHPVDVEPDAEMRARMPDLYRSSLDQNDGKLSCVTCHDVPAQCLPGRRLEQTVNSRFLRDYPHRTRTKQCYYCHDAEKYARLNPHIQVAADGTWLAGTCRLCHREEIDVLRDIRGIEYLDFNIDKDLSAICTGCHPRKPHPGGDSFVMFSTRPEDGSRLNHLVRPSGKILNWMRQQMRANDLHLPFEPRTGKIFCATCHNPHDEGIVENGIPGHLQDDNKRIRKGLECRSCHNL